MRKLAIAIGFAAATLIYAAAPATAHAVSFSHSYGTNPYFYRAAYYRPYRYRYVRRYPRYRRYRYSYYPRYRYYYYYPYRRYYYPRYYSYPRFFFGFGW